MADSSFSSAMRVLLEDAASSGGKAGPQSQVARTRKWRAKDPERYNEYQRVYMREYRKRLSSIEKEEALPLTPTGCCPGCGIEIGAMTNAESQARYRERKQQ